MEEELVIGGEKIPSLIPGVKTTKEQPEMVSPSSIFVNLYAEMVRDGAEDDFVRIAGSGAEPCDLYYSEFDPVNGRSASQKFSLGQGHCEFHPHAVATGMLAPRQAYVAQHAQNVLPGGAIPDVRLDDYSAQIGPCFLLTGVMDSSIGPVSDGYLMMRRGGF